MKTQNHNHEKILSDLENSKTNLEKGKFSEYNIDNCSCMSCGCFKSAWTVVLSPAGVAAGMAASAAAAAL